MIETGRRGFLTGLTALVAAPAIIRVAPLMKISVPRPAFLACDGALLLAHQYPDLYAAVGNAYGGTEGLTFRLPDFPMFGMACQPRAGMPPGAVVKMLPERLQFFGGLLA
jgi:hypothetical protein